VQTLAEAPAIHETKRPSLIKFLYDAVNVATTPLVIWRVDDIDPAAEHRDEGVQPVRHDQPLRQESSRGIAP
jgi:hypothetical protein